jgi:hypothetical protein
LDRFSDLQELDCAAVYQEEIHIPVFKLLGESPDESAESVEEAFVMAEEYVTFDPTGTQ